MKQSQSITETIGLCTIHPKEKLMFICTKRLCKLPRLLCCKCLFIKQHPECENNEMILIEDLEKNEYIESLQNWIKNEQYRKYLNSDQKERANKNNMLMLLELSEYIESRFSKLMSSINQRLFLQQKNLIDQTKEIFEDRCYEQHFSIEKLIKILKANNESSQIERDNSLHSYFSYDQEHYFNNNKETSLVNLKETIEKCINSLDQCYKNVNIGQLQYFPRETFEINRFPNEVFLFGSQEKTDCVNFLVNENINLEGISIFAQSYNPIEGVLKIFKEENEENMIIWEKKFECFKEEKEKMVLIKVEDALEICKNIKYTMIVTMIKIECIYGKTGKSIVDLELKTKQNKEIRLDFFDLIEKKFYVENYEQPAAGKLAKIYFSIK